MSGILKFSIISSGEKAAGIIPYEDEVTIKVESGSVGDPEEFEDYMLQNLQDWYDGAKIVVVENTLNS